MPVIYRRVNRNLAFSILSRILHYTTSGHLHRDAGVRGEVQIMPTTLLSAPTDFYTVRRLCFIPNYSIAIDRKMNTQYTIF